MYEVRVETTCGDEYFAGADLELNEAQDEVRRIAHTARQCTWLIDLFGDGETFVRGDAIVSVYIGASPTSD